MIPSGEQTITYSSVSEWDKSHPEKSDSWHNPFSCSISREKSPEIEVYSRVMA